MGLTNCNVITDAHGRERSQGTALFPAACYQDDLSLTSIPWHWHDELECILVVRGTAEVELERERFSLSTGEGLLLPSGMLHALPLSNAILRSIVFHSRLIGGQESIFWQREVRQCCSRVRMTPDISWQREWMDSIGQAWLAITHEMDEYENIARYYLTRALHLVSSNMPGRAVRTEKRDTEETVRLKVMLQYIGDHLAESISLSQIAASAALSESSCLRCFKKGIGTTPGQLLRQMRIERACELLRNSDSTSGEIGAACGFTDESYFIRTFRALRGMTPGEYREKETKRSAISRE